MSGHIIYDRINNKYIKEQSGVAPIVERMVGSSLKWFGHAMRKLIEIPIRRVDEVKDSPIDRGKGRPRKIIVETIKKDFDFDGLFLDIVYDRMQWHYLICVVDLYLLEKG